MRIRHELWKVCLGLWLTVGASAWAVPVCWPGEPIKNSANELVGCQYREWDANTCNSTAPGAMLAMPPTNDGFCLTCLREPYRSQVLAGNWSELNPNDFTCMSCINKPANNVGWWSFDENVNFFESYDLSAGLNVWDRIAVAQTSAAQPLVGEVQGAWRLDGVDDFLRVEDHPSLNFGTGSFSFEGWVQLDSASSYTGVRVLLDKRQFTNGYYGYHIALYNRQPLLQLADGGYTNWVSPIQVPQDNQWHHIAVTVLRASQTGIKFYVDGQPAGVFDPRGRPGNLTTPAKLHMGRTSVGGSATVKLGMDEFSLYKRSLAPAEIQRIFNSGRFGACKDFPPESWWPHG